MSTGVTSSPDGAVLPRRTALAAALTGLLAAVTACSPGRATPLRTVAGATGTVAYNTVTLGIIGILTADLDRSLGFYRRLGLDVPAGVDGDNYRLRTPDGRVLFWETAAVVNSFDPAWALPPAGDRRIVLEFGFTTPDDLDAAHRTLVAAGAPSRLNPFDLGGGIRYAIVVDPDGNQISLRHPVS